MPLYVNSDVWRPGTRLLARAANVHFGRHARASEGQVEPHAVLHRYGLPMFAISVNHERRAILSGDAIGLSREDAGVISGATALAGECGTAALARVRRFARPRAVVLYEVIASSVGPPGHGRSSTKQACPAQMNRGTLKISLPFRADWWATMPGTVMFRAMAMSTIGLRSSRIAVTNSFIRWPAAPP